MKHSEWNSAQDRLVRRRLADHDRELLGAAVGRPEADHARVLGALQRHPRFADRTQRRGAEVGIVGDRAGLDPQQVPVGVQQRERGIARSERHGQGGRQKLGELGERDRGGGAALARLTLGHDICRQPLAGAEGRIDQPAHLLGIAERCERQTDHGGAGVQRRH